MRVITCVIFTFCSQSLHELLKSLKSKLLLNTIKIKEITNLRQCQEACLQIRLHCEDLSALGFDCEWITVDGKQRPVALVQLATVHGLCCLFRLNILQEIPQDLKNILSDPKILKLGISPLQDSKLLKLDYNAQVVSTLDLRYLYPTSNGLASMAVSEIGINLNKHWRLRCSNWESPELSDSQKDYAAKDAFVAIEIFKKWLNTKTTELWKNDSYSNLLIQFNTELSRYLDINYSPKNVKGAPVEVPKGKIIPESLNYESKKAEKSSFITRKSPLYHNCFMHAPDGELLCSCDRRKAEWYVEKGLATVMTGEPFSIKLLFEPAARSGDTTGGRFYQHLKQNCCVVCGESNSYLKHSVVPKEYRKHFPNSMKDHQSHDIVLMCVRCHHIASKHNEVLRNTLAIMCNAPITAPKVTTSKPIQEVKNSAKALICAGDHIPLERRIRLENKIKNYYEIETLTPEILNITANLETRIINKTDESHGLKVVKHFMQQSDGLRGLELLWRQHFLNNMKPEFLPALWSVNHNHSVGWRNHPEKCLEPRLRSGKLW